MTRQVFHLICYHAATGFSRRWFDSDHFANDNQVGGVGGSAPNGKPEVSPPRRG